MSKYVLQIYIAGAFRDIRSLDGLNGRKKLYGDKRRLEIDDPGRYRVIERRVKNGV